MISYLLLVLAAMATSYLAVRLYQTTLRQKFLDEKMVSFPSDHGKAQRQSQRGFVRPGADRSRRGTAAGNGLIGRAPARKSAGKTNLVRDSIRKPWGW